MFTFLKKILLISAPISLMLVNYYLDTDKQNLFKEKKHNILFIGIDDLRPMLNSYGYDHMVTPNLNKLASEGVQFNEAYVNIAVCGASRASILTGVRGSFNRFTSYTSRVDKELPKALTLAKIFKNNGYSTGSIGKISHFADDSKNDWDVFFDYRQQTDYKNKKSIKRRKELNKKAPNGYNAGPPFEYADVENSEYNDGKVTNIAIEQLRRYKDNNEPFFLAVGYVSPHLPFIQPTKYGDLYSDEDLIFSKQKTVPENAPKRSIAHDWLELRNWYIDIPDSGPLSYDMEKNLIKSYYASVSYLDAVVGKLIDSLDELGLRDNTTIVFWSDHGFFLGEHGFWCKHHTFQEAIHVPLIVSSPGLKKNVKTNSLVEYVDIYPTLCELVGIDPPEYIHGKSFVPVLKNPKEEIKNEIYSRYQTLEVVQDKKYSYHEVLNRKSGDVEYNMLFDIENDKYQYVNIANESKYKTIVDSYSQKLKRMRDFSNKPIIIK